jgi:D-3-phosphoglycerate dehydrogenase
MPQKLVLTEALPTVGMRALSGCRGVDVVVLPEPTTAALAAVIGDADGVIMVMERPALTTELIGKARQLCVACRFGAGYDNLDVTALTRRGVPLVTTGDANADAVAEHALYLMLSLAKRGLLLDREVRAGLWARSFGGVELREKICVIVGYGRIGRRIAKLVGAFGMKVEIVDPAADESECTRNGYVYAESLADALPRADFVVLACAYIPATEGLIGEQALALLKKSAFLINVARGPIVDERALAAALAGGRLAGAGLDVLAVEPPAKDNPLLQRDDVVLTPHSAAFIDTAYDRMAVRVVEKAVAGLQRRLTRQDVVNPECFDVTS